MTFNKTRMQKLAGLLTEQLEIRRDYKEAAKAIGAACAELVNAAYKAEYKAEVLDDDEIVTMIVAELREAFDYANEATLRQIALLLVSEANASAGQHI